MILLLENEGALTSVYSLIHKVMEAGRDLRRCDDAEWKGQVKKFPL